MNKGPVIVSSCLLGFRSRYNGKDNASEEAFRLIEGRQVIPVCPEQMGGLPTPRPRAWLTDGDGKDVIEGRSGVVDEHGFARTEHFLRGAEEILKIARLTGATTAILKEKSPSRGVSLTNRNKVCTQGKGVTAALLEKEGIEVIGL